jgi:hypothetical protein
MGDASCKGGWSKGDGGVEMPSTRECRKAHLMKEAERMIDKLLDRTNEASEPNLAQIEGAVLELCQQFSEEMAHEAIEVQAVVAPGCPKCGRPMQYKGQKEVEPRKWVGDVRFRRGYYYCGECGEGPFRCA